MKIINNKYNLWVFLLFFSFAYEKPLLIISSLDKVNPRLFDLVLFFGLFFLLKHPIKYNNRIFKLWSYIIFWFTFCCFLGLVIFSFPINVKQLMIYFLFEYYKGLFIILIFLTIPKNQDTLKSVILGIIVGGLFVSAYCVYEFTTGVTEVLLTEGKSLIKPAGMVWGPYIGSYFEIAVYLPFAITISLVTSLYLKGKNKILLLTLTIFMSWPIFFTGSRTAIFLFLLCLIIISIFSIKKSFSVILSFTIIIIMLSSFTNYLDFIYKGNETIDRLQRFESGKQEFNSVSSRLSILTQHDIYLYDEATLLPLIGGGFYVVPMEGKYRVGYGIHNIFLFPLEQSGIIGLILFIIFVYITFSVLWKGLRLIDKNKLEYWFVLGVLVYFVASLLIGLAGHTFWRGFTTYNFNTLRILSLVIATLVITDVIKKREKINEKNIINK
jgi:O-antigen ligase